MQTAGDAAARSTVELATYPYGSVQEFDFSSDAGAGKWSVSKQGGKTYVTLKVGLGCSKVLTTCSNHDLACTAVHKF
jgi:hypothetical protein